MAGLKLVTFASPAGVLSEITRRVAQDWDAGWTIVVPRTHLQREVTRLLLQHRKHAGWLGPRVMTVDELLEHFARTLAGTPALTPLQVRQIVAAIITELHEESEGEAFRGQVIQGRVSEATLRALTRVFAEIEPFRWTADDLETRLKQGPTSEIAEARANQIAQVYRRFQERVFAANYQGPQGRAVAAIESAKRIPPPEGIRRFIFLGLDTSGLNDIGVRAVFALAENPSIEDVQMVLILPERLDPSVTAWETHGNAHLYAYWAEYYSERQHQNELQQTNEQPGDLAAIARDPFLYREAPVPATGAVRAVRVPDTQLEVEWVAADIKRRVLAGEARVDEIAIIARDMDQRASDFEREFGRLGIPVVSSRQETIGNVPAVAAILTLFRLMAFGWRVEDLVAIAETPYLELGLNPTLLARIGGAGTAPQGIEDWQRRISAFRHQTNTGLTQNQIGLGDLPPDLINQAEALEVAFGRFVTQVEQIFGAAEAHPPTQWVKALVRALEVWQIQRKIYATSPEIDRHERARIARADLDGINALIRAANDWLRGREIAGLKEEPMSARDWYGELVAIANETTIRTSTYPREAVHLLLPAQAALRQWKITYIVSLVDGVFPQHAELSGETLTDEERRALQLPTAEQRSARERLLFHLAAATATEKLILVAPAADDRGKALVTSPFMTCMPLRIAGLKIEQLTASALLPTRLDDVLQRRDVDLLAAEHYKAACQANGDSIPLNEDEFLRRWLAEPVSRRVCRAWAVERLRSSLDAVLGAAGDEATKIPFGEYVALFPKGALPSSVTDDAASFSPSELSAYERCHFRVFAKRLLGLGAGQDREDDHDEAAAFGTLQHRILERFYDQLMRDGALPPQNESDVANAMQQLERIAEVTVRDYVASAHSRLWRLDLDFVLDVLRDFVVRDLERMRFVAQDDAAPFPRARIFTLEEPIGYGHKPIEVDHEGVRFRLHGRIDRVEEIVDERLPDAAQSWLIIRDYKTGRGKSSVKPEHYIQGKDFQLPLYSYMAERHFGRGVFAFGELRTAQPKDPDPLSARQVGIGPDGQVQLYKPADLPSNPVAAAQRTAIEIATDLVRSMRAGFFAPQPGRQCYGCIFKDVCRAARMADPARARARAPMPLSVSAEVFEKALQKHLEDSEEPSVPDNVDAGK